MKRMNQLYFLAAVFLLFSIVVVSCKKEKENNNNNTITPQNNSGLGNNPGFPSGTIYALPSYVKILGEIRGGVSKNIGPVHPEDKQYFRIPPQKDINENWTTFGSGTYVSLFIKFYNQLSVDTSVTIPGGLIFIDSTKVYQHGIILQSLNIPLAASDTTYACLMAYCCNLDRSISDWGAIYHTGPVTNNTELMRIINILKNKQMISMLDYNTIYEIQYIIWDVTDFNKQLTQEQINYLNSLP